MGEASIVRKSPDILGTSNKIAASWRLDAEKVKDEKLRTPP